MNVVFNLLAINELNDSIDFYDLEVKGLGKQFKNEVQDSIKRIVKNPKAWSVEKGEIRRYILLKFPYKILYSIEKDHIFIIAIAHMHRRPNYWIERIKSNK